MYKRLTIVDIIMLFSALASLIFSEVSFYKGEKDVAIFVGLWVPSILGFAIYLKLILKKDD
jgi:lipopolysaccharide export LptBFGC system permease protein LptF